MNLLPRVLSNWSGRLSSKKGPPRGVDEYGNDLHFYRDRAKMLAKELGRLRRGYVSIECGQRACPTCYRPWAEESGRGRDNEDCNQRRRLWLDGVVKDAKRNP